MKKQSCIWGKDDMYSLYAESVFGEYTPFWSSHAFAEFMFPVTGNYRLCIGDNEYHVGERNIVFIEGNQLHKVIPNSIDEFRLVSFVVNWPCFSEELLGQGVNFQIYTLRHNLMKGNIITLSEENSVKIQRLFSELYDEIEEKNRGYIAFVNSVLLQIFVVLNREVHKALGNSSAEKSQPSLSDTIAAIVDYISENYNKQIGLSSIAERFWINPSQLSRNFKKETGANITDFIRAVRMYYAKELLIKTTKNISEISMDVGYNSISHFSTIFLQETGMSPKAFRSGFANVE